MSKNKTAAAEENAFGAAPVPMESPSAPTFAAATRYINRLNQAVRVQAPVQGKTAHITIPPRGTLALEGKETPDLAAKVKSGVLARK